MGLFLAKSTVVSIEFLLTSLIVIVSPGTGVLYTLAAGLARGPRASVVAAFGCTLGIVPHMIAAIMGLAAPAYQRAGVSDLEVFGRGLSPLHGLERVGGAWRATRARAGRRPLVDSGDRAGHPHQHPQ